MPKIHYISPDGTKHRLDGPVGRSVMEVAVKEGVPGIVAECGGAAACATCHVYVAEDFLAAAGTADDLELEMLEDTKAELRPTSRLSCQIEITDALDGAVIEIAARQ